MGMKFGIHIMRGISTAAVKANTPIKGYTGSAKAADVGIESEMCPWWRGVMSVNLTTPAGQAFYVSFNACYSSCMLLSCY